VDAYEFTTDLKVLELSAYDMILGMDWLELHSPMKIHWKQKWLAVPYKNATVVLYGNHPEAPKGTVIHLCEVQVSISDSAPVYMAIPLEIQTLIQDLLYCLKFQKICPPLGPVTILYP
jgi:hypothetical protein